MNFGGFRKRFITFLAVIAAGLTIGDAPASAQTVQFPSTSPSTYYPSLGGSAGGTTATLSSTPYPSAASGPASGWMGLSTPAPGSAYPSSTAAVLSPAGAGQPPAFPQYSPPATTAPAYGGGLWPSSAAPVMPANPPGTLFPGNNLGGGPLAGGNYDWQNAWGTTPPANSGSIFSDSLINSDSWRLGNGWFNNPSGPILPQGSQQVLRFFLGPRLRHSYIAGGGDPTDLEINDTDFSLAFAFPQFLGSTQPLVVLPSFSSHLWEGPANGTADLPSAAYSAFLDAGWQSDPVRTFGLETGIRLGVFTDYETMNSESFRILGKLLGRVRVTPTSVAKAGVYWVDRNRIKLVPAGGIFWTPNPDTRFELFFPEPKLTHYLATIGRTDVWWYGTGYFGGGTWTITRASGAEDSVDINDLRVMLGLDFGQNQLLRGGQRTGFVEAGYAFEREIIYRFNPQDNVELENAFVVRAGVGY